MIELTYPWYPRPSFNLMVKLALEQYKGEPLKTPVQVDISFILTKPRRTKFPFPPLKPDNLVSQIKKSLVGTVIKDQKMIGRLTIKKKWGKEDKIVITIEEDNY